jgi:RNA polymerase sigma factor (sigma-70 family)
MAAGGVEAAELWQEGQIGLWQAVLHFEPQRGTTFAAYARVVLYRRLRQWLRQAQRPAGVWVEEPGATLQEQEAAAQEQQARRAAVQRAVGQLSVRQQQVVRALYGLDGEVPRSLSAVARQQGLSRARLSQLHVDALGRLRQPAIRAGLWRVWERPSRAGQQRVQAAYRRWLRQRHQLGQP